MYVDLWSRRQVCPDNIATFVIIAQENVIFIYKNFGQTAAKQAT
jgi:hypothetical protein